MVSKQKRPVTGTVISGYGIGSLVLAPIQTAICNPNNVEPTANPDGGDDKYFTDPDVLQRLKNSKLMLHTGILNERLIGFQP